MITQDILLTMKNQNKIKVISMYLSGDLSLKESIQTLKCSERSFYRWVVKFKESGPLGLIHGNKGKENPKRIQPDLISKILNLKKNVYFSFNDIHFKEMLLEEHQIKIGRETLRCVLRRNQIAPKQKRRSPKYHVRRERKALYGHMIQIDASVDYWLGPMNHKITIHGGVDDATGKVWAVFDHTECMFGYFNLMREIISDAGIPVSLYSDRHTIFHTPDSQRMRERMEGLEPHMTHFGRGMHDLGIHLIKAYSPQAKGRIERLWRTFQDRLIAEMGLHGIRTLEEAQLFLKGFLKRYNERFQVKAREKGSSFKKTPKQCVLDDVLSLKETRVVRNDNTISYENKVLQLPRPKSWRTYAKKRVEVWDRQDGVIKVVYNNQVLVTFNPQTYEDVLNTA